ncbi:MAG: hypothetical protein H7X95_01690 [Deltaproteobacteria bacterium]|nr:hypothetical protein [Deltaproteobacteria bacterium]
MMMTAYSVAQVRFRHAPGRAFSFVTVALLLSMPLFASCADPAGTLLIVQNQVPVIDENGLCLISPDSNGLSLTSGVLDVDLDQPRPYFVHPLIQNRLPSRVTSGIERNSMALQQVNTSIKAPPGVDPKWAAGCPGTFSSPAAGQMDPGSSRSLSVFGFQTCHAARLRALIEEKAIPSDLAQPVYFTVELTAVAKHNGSDQTSPTFPFDVRVCAGCLQAMYPLTPSCADAPKPNPLHGNPCNIAQDGPAVLCCTNPGGVLICPAPDA